jgi:hypothetical protein
MDKEFRRSAAAQRASVMVGDSTSAPEAAAVLTVDSLLAGMKKSDHTLKL